jgi:centractin
MKRIKLIISYLMVILYMFNYKLGSSLKIASEKYKATEILFSPDKIGLEYPGVHEMVVNSIKKCDLDLRKNLYNSIIAAGGTTLFTGFSDRLHKSI